MLSNSIVTLPRVRKIILKLIDNKELPSDWVREIALIAENNPIPEDLEKRLLRYKEKGDFL